MIHPILNNTIENEDSMSLSVKPEGDRIVFVDEHNVPIGGKGRESHKNGIKGWEKGSVSSLWHWFCHDVMGWVVDVQLGDKTFVLGKNSAAYYIKRNVPHLKEALIDSEFTIASVLKQLMQPKGLRKKVKKERISASLRTASLPSQFRPLIKTKEEWISEFKKQGILIDEIFLRKNGFTFHEGRYSTSAENLQRAICQAPDSSNPPNARFQAQLRSTLRTGARTPLATIHKGADEVAQNAQDTSTITVLDAERAHERRALADSARRARSLETRNTTRTERAAVLRVPERPTWLERAPSWLRATDGAFAASAKREKQNALNAALTQALEARRPSLLSPLNSEHAAELNNGDLFYLVVKKIHNSSTSPSEILEKLHSLPLMEKFYLYDIACGAARFAANSATKDIIEAFFIDGIAKANSLERSRLKSYVMLQLNQNEDAEVASFYNHILSLVGTP